MKTYVIKRSSGLKTKARKVGRGNATKGNYSGKGLKGQKARSGYSSKPYFEGGQTSIVQKLPKMRGFKRHNKLLTNYSVINLGNLEKNDNVKNNMDINKFSLKELGYIKKESEFIKILGTGKLTKKLNFIDIDKFSKTAIDKIEKSGSKIS